MIPMKHIGVGLSLVGISIYDIFFQLLGLSKKTQIIPMERKRALKGATLFVFYMKIYWGEIIAD